jgi:hypothetical protein
MSPSMARSGKSRQRNNFGYPEVQETLTALLAN